MDISDKVIAYLDNELTASERADFENELSTNAELQQELSFQKDIIASIQQARKAELISMLNNVPIGGSSIGFGGSTLQYITAAVVTILIGFGIYYFWPSNSSQPIAEQSEIALEATPSDTLEKSIEATESIQQDDKVAPVAEEPSKEVPKAADKIPAERAVTPPPVQEESAGQEEVVEEKIPEETISTSEAKPNVIEGFDTEDGSEPDIPQEKLFDKSTLNAEAVDVEIDGTHKKYNFHYQFKNNRLMLFGDFNETYEILDLMKDNQRALYLVYKDNYYQLLFTQLEVKELVPITDRNMINDLSKIRKDG